MATGLIDQMEKDFANSYVDGITENLRHLGHSLSENDGCDSCAKRSRINHGQFRHEDRMRRWLERKIGVTRAKVITHALRDY